MTEDRTVGIVRDNKTEGRSKNGWAFFFKKKAMSLTKKKRKEDRPSSYSI
jgi:hypothetical protein